MSVVTCPQCGGDLTDDKQRPVDGTERHCVPQPTRSCVWVVHACGAVIDHRHPDRFIQYGNTAKGNDRDQPSD